MQGVIFLTENTYKKEKENGKMIGKAFSKKRIIQEIKEHKVADKDPSVAQYSELKKTPTKVHNHGNLTSQG